MGEGRLRALRLKPGTVLPKPVVRRVSPVQKAQAVCSPAMEGELGEEVFH